MGVSVAHLENSFAKQFLGTVYGDNCLRQFQRTHPEPTVSLERLENSFVTVSKNHDCGRNSSETVEQFRNSSCSSKTCRVLEGRVSPSSPAYLLLE